MKCKRFQNFASSYQELAQGLSALGLVYMPIVDHSSMGALTVSENVKQTIRQHFKGNLILSGGYDSARAEHDLLEKRGDLIVFGRPFITNPDFVEMMQAKTPSRDPILLPSISSLQSFTGNRSQCGWPHADGKSLL